MRQATITISGTYGGSIWMPAVVCAKRFETTVEADQTLREAVLQVLDDGDFQNCSIAEGTVGFARSLPDRRGFQRYHRRSMDMAVFRSIADCLASDDLADEILSCFGEDD